MRGTLEHPWYVLLVDLLVDLGSDVFGLLLHHVIRVLFCQVFGFFLFRLDFFGDIFRLGGLVLCFLRGNFFELVLRLGCLLVACGPIAALEADTSALLVLGLDLGHLVLGFLGLVGSSGRLVRLASETQAAGYVANGGFFCVTDGTNSVSDSTSNTINDIL